MLLAVFLMRKRLHFGNNYKNNFVCDLSCPVRCIQHFQKRRICYRTLKDLFTCLLYRHQLLVQWVCNQVWPLSGLEYIGVLPFSLWKLLKSCPSDPANHPVVQVLWCLIFLLPCWSTVQSWVLCPVLLVFGVWTAFFPTHHYTLAVCMTNSMFLMWYKTGFKHTQS